MTLTGHTEGVSAVQWMSDTEICSASWDHTIRLWDVSQAAQTSTIVRYIATLKLLTSIVVRVVCLVIISIL